MKIFLKYILKEVIFYTLIFWLIFSVMVSLIKGVLAIEEIIDLNPSLGNIFKVMGLVFSQLISFTLPLSSFMGVLFAMHRFSLEREILGFFCLGFSLKDFLKPLIIFSLIMFFLTFLAHFFLLPYAKRQQKLLEMELVKAQAEKQEIQAKKPIFLEKQYLLYVKDSEKKKNSTQIKEVFLLDYKDPQKKSVFLSRRGELFSDKNLLVLYNGSGFFLEKDSNLEVLKFKSYYIKIVLNTQTQKLYFTRGEQTIKELKQKIETLDKNSKDYFRYLTEYYHRYAYSFSVIFLIFSAFLINFYLITSHKFWIFLIGIIYYLLYYLFYNFSISLSETGKLHPLIAFLIFYGCLSFFIIIEFLFIKKRGYLVL